MTLLHLHNRKFVTTSVADGKQHRGSPTIRGEQKAKAEKRGFARQLYKRPYQAAPTKLF